MVALNTAIANGVMLRNEASRLAARWVLEARFFACGLRMTPFRCQSTEWQRAVDR